jgi:hypothetical protein
MLEGSDEPFRLAVPTILIVPDCEAFRQPGRRGNQLPRALVNPLEPGKETRHDA